MKPKTTLRSFLSIASSALLTISYSHAATLYWDGGIVDILTPGNGVSGGTAGNWDTTLTNWDQGNTLAHVAWSGTTNTASFGGTAATVTLTAPVTVGGLTFFSNSAYNITGNTLTLGAANNTIGLINATQATTSSATITSTLAGPSSNVTLSSISPTIASTLTLAGAGGWTGSTQANAGFTLQLNSASTALLNTSGITLNGGTINQNYTAVVDRINDSAAITSFGGTLSTNNPNTALNFTETIGAVTLESGVTNLVHSASPALLTSQNLILTSLTRNGTSAVNFASSSLLNTTKNIIVVTGATATTAGQIIAPWAVTGNTASQFDYAVYNGSSQVVSAGIAASAETAWSAATDAYTANATPATGTAGSFTLTGSRNVTALRSISASTAATADFGTDIISQANHVFVDGDAVVFNNGTLPTGLATNTVYFVRDAVALTSFKLAATSGGAAIDFTTSNGSGITALGALQLTTGNNLGTTGILNASGNTMFITGPGALTLPSGTSGQLHVNSGAAPIVISAPITNNATAPGILTLVKNGVNALTLSGTNTYTGGTVVNSGQLNWTNANQLGASTFRNLTVNGIATLNGNDGTSLDALSVGSGGVANFTTAGYVFTSTTGSGVVSYRSTSATNRTMNLGNASGFTGTVQALMGGGTNMNPAVQFSRIGDAAGSALQFGGGSTDGGQTANFTLNGAAPLIFNNRQVQILSRTASNHGVLQCNLNNSSALAANTWVINTDLEMFGQTGRNLNLRGTNTGANAFNGVISDGNFGGSVNLTKQDSGSWIVGGNNTYSGSTSVSVGTLNIQNANALGSTVGGTTVANAARLEIQGNITTAAEALTLTPGTGGSAMLLNVSGTNIWSGSVTSNTATSSHVSRIQSDLGKLTLAGAVNLTGSAHQLVFQGNGELEVSGQITGVGRITGSATGAGVRTLSNTNNNYTGSTFINGGTLVGIGANAFGDTTGITMGNTAGATLSLRGDSSTDFVKSSDDTTLYSVTTTTATGVTINVDQATVAGTTAKTMAIGTLLLNTAITNDTTFTGANNTSLSVGAVTTGNSVSGTETLTNNISVGGSLTLASLTVNRTATPTVVFNGTGNTTVSGAISQAATTALTMSGSGVLTLGGANTYTGDTTVNTGGTLALADNAQLKFVLGATSGTNNSLTGAGTATLNGDFVIDTSAADALASGTWTLEDVTTLTGAYGSTFTVQSGFVDAGSNTWTKVVGAKTYTFDETTGILTLVSTGGSPYDTWATSKGLTGLPGSSTDPAKNADPDKDGRNNLGEFAFNGDPLSGSDNGKVYVLTEDSDIDGDALKELILTVAVRTGTPAFAGSPSPSAIQAADGITYSIEGSLDLASFPTVVNVVSPIITGLPAAGTGYEYRSFSLNGSNGLTGKGFLRAKVTSP